MFTVCPKCALTLAVTAADLRAGQGYVRCGRCMNVFNALLALSEEPAEGNAPELAASASASASASSALSTVSDDDLPRSHLATERSSDGAIENESTQADGTGSFETIVLEGDAITQTEEFVPEESVEHEIAALTQRLSDARRESAAHEDAGADASANANANANAEQIILGGRPRRTGWTIGCAFLVLLLALQAVNHWRDALAASPLVGAPIANAYALVGVPLDPRWNLGAYDVRQQGAAADPNDSHIVHVRLSVANHDRRSQPAPLLRLTLLDLYGKPIAARDLTPAEYWPAGHAVRRLLAPDERIDTQVALRDPAADSASFELDVCLGTSGGGVRCAGDVSTAPAPIP
jgi:predicted Zn finger-like uncharacterized protein